MRIFIPKSIPKAKKLNSKQRRNLRRAGLQKQKPVIKPSRFKFTKGLSKKTSSMYDRSMEKGNSLKFYPKENNESN